MKIHHIPLCAAAALLAACDPKPTTPPLPDPTPTMHTTVAPLPTPSPIMDVMPTPGSTVSPMPTASPTAIPGEPSEMGAGPMATPSTSDKGLIAPPTSMPGDATGGSSQGSDPAAR